MLGSVRLVTHFEAMLQGDMPAFANQRLVRFDEHVFREKITQVAQLENARIDLSLVAGTEHPDYYRSTWAELIGQPPGHDRCVFKRLNLNLQQLAASAQYYRNAEAFTSSMVSTSSRREIAAPCSEGFCLSSTDCPRSPTRSPSRSFIEHQLSKGKPQSPLYPPTLDGHVLVALALSYGGPG